MNRSAVEPLCESSAASTTARAGLAALGIAAWFSTQSLLASRGLPDGITDGMHALLAPGTHWLATNRQGADVLLVVTSAIIDALGCFLLTSGILGRSIRPFLGLMMLFVLRQACQALIALPAPQGMIWHYPGVPSLFVTYSTGNDFFFSGHTAIAVYGALELARYERPWLKVTAVSVAVIEAFTVLVLRAHYSMDVFTAILAAFVVSSVATRLAPLCDRILASQRLPGVS